MYVSDLALNDFRSYRELVLSLTPGTTAFVGSNGQGKTNLVEAISYLSSLSSHRVGTDQALVRRADRNEPQPGAAVVRAKVIHGDRPTVVELEIVAGKANRARINRGNAHARDLLGLVRTVVFAPEDLALVRDDPSVRRRFLDDLVVTMTPRLAAVRAEHDKLLKQRAALLKSVAVSRGRADLTTLDVWDAHLARAAATLMAARLDVVARLRPWVEASYEEVSVGQSRAFIAYRSSLDMHEGIDEPTPQTCGWNNENCQRDVDIAQLTQRLIEAMTQLRPKEIDRGANLVGTHRDDLILYLGDLPAKGFASHGEQWSLALALRLGSYEMLRHDVDAYGSDGEPILILDDVFAELDARRRRALTTMVSQAQQVLITAAVVDDVPQELGGERFFVDHSVVSRG